MTQSPGSIASDLRGVGRLVIDATTGITDLVEAMHRNIARVPGVTSSQENGRTSGVTGFVYRTVRGVTRVVGGGVDAALALVSPALADVPSPRARGAIVAALNGVLGDHLVETKNPLATVMQMRTRTQGLTLSRDALAEELPQATGKVVVFVHGLCMNEEGWMDDADNTKYADSDTCDFGKRLADEDGFTSIYLRYNTGRHVSENGREFAAQLKALLAAWPVPIESLVIVTHSMGGLVSRSAVHFGRKARHAWCKSLDAMVFLGTPHLGAPLERGGHWIDLLLGAAPYASPFAKLGKVRSNGINDLRHGSVTDEDWHAESGAPRAASEHSVVPLPTGVRCYAIAATMKPSGHQKTDWIGDGLVQLTSALGEHENGARSLKFSEQNRAVLHDRNHMDLLTDRKVYALLHGFITT
ncbi:MAG: alpha/beta hydrolase [Casimicrobium sp.]